MACLLLMPTCIIAGLGLVSVVCAVYVLFVSNGGFQQRIQFNRGKNFFLNCTSSDLVVGDTLVTMHAFHAACWYCLPCYSWLTCMPLYFLDLIFIFIPGHCRGALEPRRWTPNRSGSCARWQLCSDISQLVCIAVCVYKWNMITVSEIRVKHFLIKKRRHLCYAFCSVVHLHGPKCSQQCSRKSVFYSR